MEIQNRNSISCPVRMNTLHRLVLALGVLLPSLAPIGFAQNQWKQVSVFEFKWNADRPATRFTLEIPKVFDGSGDFTRVRIQVPGRQAQTLSNKDGWVKCSSDSAGLSPAALKSNLAGSDYMLFLPADKRGRVLAFLFGWAYGSSPGSLDVFELTLDSKPKLILHRNELGLHAMEDLNSDGVAEIIGQPCLSQTWGNGLLTYDPYHVYQLSPTKGGLAVLSLPLSKAYNLRHYYGWSGPACREDIAVVLHPPGGGGARIMKSKDAEQLMEQSGIKH